LKHCSEVTKPPPSRVPPPLAVGFGGKRCDRPKSTPTRGDDNDDDGDDDAPVPKTDTKQRAGRD
jgi:hypothetical protein